MDPIQIIVLALVQGLTEFLPISSSAHLILAPILLDWQDQGLAFDVAVHFGTLLAVVWYFRHSLMQMGQDWISCCLQRQQVGESQLAWWIILGTIPAVIAGLLGKDFIEMELRSTLVIATTTILFGLLLWWADSSGKRNKTEHDLTFITVLFIGIAQAIALVPGTSRSGITITVALLIGLNRQAASRFSFLLSIPLILAASGMLTLDLIQAPQSIEWGIMIMGAFLAGISAYFCIYFFLKLIEKISMLPFVIYRLALGGLLLMI